MRRSTALHGCLRRVELFPTTRIPSRSSSVRTVTKPINGSDFRIDREQHGTECRAKLSGRINIDSSPELRPLLLRMLTAADCQLLIVDFCEVVYIDTSGLAVLVQVLKFA